MAERRLRDAKPGGGAGKAALFGNNRKRGEFAEVVPHDS
jgi:hypothetical protein